MCGIAAVIHTRSDLRCPQVAVSIERLHHRGPDRAGCVTVPLSWGNVVLGMSRLKIVDQSDLAVPQWFESVEVGLAYNGEVYNWQELRTALSTGAPWETSCDSEVIARAWRRWGLDCLSRFNGMWGLVLVDKQQDCVFLARDRAGKKPLFYAHRSDRLYVASEAKALPVELTEDACPDANSFEYDFGATTPFRGVYRLPAGCCSVLRGPSDVFAPTVTKWWSLPAWDAERHSLDMAALAPDPYAETVRELTELIVDAVRLRVVSEVPVALQLSGGLDSAIILAAWRQFDKAGAAACHKYCIDFSSEGINNISEAQLVAPEVETLTFTPDDLRAALPRVAYHLDTPATWSAVCLWFLARQIHDDGHKIVLSGEGADELFGGYTRYAALYHLDQMHRDERLAAYGPLLTHMFGTPVSIVARLLDRSEDGSGLANVVDHVISETQRSDGSLARLCMRTEFKTTMQVLLRMGDRMASAWALENRCPFLDHRIVEMAAMRIPTTWLIDEEMNKRILRDVALALGVPDAIVHARSKRGLAIPWAKWAPTLDAASPTGTRGVWDRSGFSTLMSTHWRETCLRAALCVDCDLESMVEL